MDINDFMKRKDTPSWAQPPAQTPAQRPGDSSFLFNDDVLRNMENQKDVPWADYMRQLGFINLRNITDFNSPLYQQYAQYLQKNTPSIGINSMLAPLLAGGASYAGGQNIANAKLNQMNRERNDTINQGVSGFALNMQNQVLPQIGQVMGSFDNQYERTQRDAQFAQSNSPFNQFMGVLGQGVGMAANYFTGGASGAMSMATDYGNANSRRKNPWE